MISRRSIIILIVFLLSLCGLGCSGGGMSGLTPGISDETMLSSSGMTGTSGSLASVDGTAIPLADIYVDGELVSSTDENGDYTLALEPGSHSVSFGYEDIIFFETTIDDSSRSLMQFPRPPKTGAVGGRVFGRPLDNESGDFMPIEGAIVMVIDKDHHWFDADITNEEGKFLIRHAPPGDARLVVFARGYLPESCRIFINPDALVLKDIFLRRAPHLGHLLGLVRDPEFNPIPDVKITLTNPNDPTFIRETLTTRCGVFLINKLKPGIYKLNAEKDGYEPFERPVKIEVGKNFVKFKLIPIEGGDGGDG